MKLSDLVFLVFIILTSIVLWSGCAPDETNNYSIVDNECVIYTKSKIKCKHSHCHPLPSPTATPEPDPTSEPVASPYPECSEVES